MTATIHTSEGPQLTMDALAAIRLILTLPPGDYTLTFSDQGDMS